jgi:hypothetical protein
MGLSMADTGKIAEMVGKRWLERKAATDTPMWMYVCPDTKKKFYTPEKLTSITSPYTGTSFVSQPEKVLL